MPEERGAAFILVGEEGVEPPRPEASGSKPDVSAIFTTLPYLIRARPGSLAELFVYFGAAGRI